MARTNPARSCQPLGKELFALMLCWSSAETTKPQTTMGWCSETLLCRRSLASAAPIRSIKRCLLLLILWDMLTEVPRFVHGTLMYCGLSRKHPICLLQAQELIWNLAVACCRGFSPCWDWGWIRLQGCMGSGQSGLPCLRRSSRVLLCICLL